MLSRALPGGTANDWCTVSVQGARLRHRHVGLLDRRGQQYWPRRGVAAQQAAFEPVADLLDQDDMFGLVASVPTAVCTNAAI